MIRRFGQAFQKRAVLFSLAVICIVLVGCSQNFRQIAIPLPTTTGDPAPLNRALFAATDGGSHPGSITFVDVSGDTNVGVTPIGNNPVHIGLTFGGGRAVTSNPGDNTASSFQTGITTPTVNTTSLPSSANPVFSHSRQNGKFYIALSGLHELGVVDGSLSLVKEVPLGCTNPVAISQVPGGGNIYVACKGGGVAVVTPSDNVLLPAVTGLTGSSPVWIDTSSDGKYTFVANQGSSTVSVICTSTDVAVCPVGDKEIAAPSVGGAPSFLKYDTHSQRVYVAGAGFVSIIDASGSTPTFSVLKTLDGTERLAGGGGCACAFGPTWVTALPDGTHFYVSDQTGKSVSAYSASNFQFIKTINLATTAEPNTAPIMIDSDKNSTKVYTANTGSNDFSIIRTSDDTEVFPGSTGGATSGRIVPGKVADPGCSDESTAGCRQTPTYVQVLP